MRSVTDTEIALEVELKRKSFVAHTTWYFSVSTYE